MSEMLSSKTVNAMLFLAAFSAFVSATFLYFYKVYPLTMAVDIFACGLLAVGFLLRLRVMQQKKLNLLIFTGCLVGVVMFLENPFSMNGMLILSSAMVLSFANWEGRKFFLVPGLTLILTVVLTLTTSSGYIHFESNQLPDFNHVGTWFLSFQCQLILVIVSGFTILELKGRLLGQIDKLKQINLQMFHVAYFDDVSGIANRKYLQQQVDSEIFAQRPFKLLVLEIHNMGLLRALQGPLKSDDCIRTVAGLIQQFIGQHGFLARVQDDQFVLLTHQMDLGANQLRLSEFFNDLGKQKEFTKIGLNFYLASTEFPADGQNYLELMKNLDVSLQQAQTRPQCELCVFSTELAQQITEQQKLRNAIQVALQEKHFYAVYQTKICARTGRVSGLEGLARVHSDGEFISPGQFIPVLHNEGWMDQFGRQMLDTIIRDIPEIQCIYGSDIKVAANVSPPMFLSLDFIPFLLDCLKRYNVSPSNLTIEITEEAFSSDVKHIIHCCRELQSHGVSVSLDDFGAGFSSLSYLKLTQFDEIKIDRTFIEDLERNDNGFLLLSSICQLIRELGSRVVIEGIEIEAHFQMVRAMTDEIQGFYFSRPLPLHILAAD